MNIVKHGTRSDDWVAPTIATCPYCHCVMDGIDSEDTTTREGRTHVAFLTCPECSNTIQLK